MEELGSIIQDLPVWAQILIMLAVMGVGAVFGVKIPKRSRSRSQRGERSSRLTTPRRRSTGARRKAERPGVSSDATPGQMGPDATSDLSADAVRTLKMTYAPSADGTPDPGEIVWTWVPFIEYDGRGKDRPVLIIARVDATSVAGCYLSTKQHPGFVAVGTGSWDSQGRPSYLNPERILRITDDGMRREGAVMRRERFQAVATELQRHIHERFL